MSRIHRALAHAFLLTCTLPIAAQTPDGPYWNEYPLPAQVQSIDALGSIVTIRTTTAVHLYSGLRRAWLVQPASASATVQLTNRYCVIQDGTMVHAYSAATGRVATLTTSPSAIVHVGSISSSWVICVEDGSSVFGFSGFLGDWVPLPAHGALATVSLASHSILVVDNANAYAFSAFFGTWVSTRIRTPGVFQALRSGALAQLAGPDELKAFSAYQNSWRSVAFPGAQAATLDARDGFAALTQGNELALFSTMTGNFVRRTYAAPPAMYNTSNVAVIDAGGAWWGYAPGIDVVRALPTPTASTVPLLAPGSLGSFAIVNDGNAPSAFNGLTGRLTPGPQGLFALTLGGLAAFAEGLTGPSYGYSALHDTWVQAPNVTPLAVTATFESVVVTGNTTYEGFSARTGGWDSLSASGTLVDQQSAGALAAVVGSNRIDVFDPGLGRWVGQPTANPAALSIWRLTGIAQDGVNGYGYSLLHKTWETEALQGTVVTHRANSSIGYVQTISHLYVFTGNGSLSNQSRFPEFSRFCVRGGEMLHMQVGPPGAGVFGLFGVASSAIPVGVLGTLRVDPDPSSIVVLPLGFVPPDGALVTHIPIPVDPLFNGLELHMQDVVVPLVGAPWLTNDSVPYIW